MFKAANIHKITLTKQATNSFLSCLALKDKKVKSIRPINKVVKKPAKYQLAVDIENPLRFKYKTKRVEMINSPETYKPINNAT